MLSFSSPLTAGCVPTLWRSCLRPALLRMSMPDAFKTKAPRASHHASAMRENVQRQRVSQPRRRGRCVCEMHTHQPDTEKFLCCRSAGRRGQKVSLIWAVPGLCGRHLYRRLQEQASGGRDATRRLLHFRAQPPVCSSGPCRVSRFQNRVRQN